MDIENHYNKLWSQSIEKFRNDEFEFDPLIGSADDNRYGITLLARPSKEIKERILKTLKEIRNIAPNQYYYPEPDLHVTILSIISCYDGFSLDQINEKDYKQIVQSAIDSIIPFEITFRGLTASPSGILIQGFPHNDQLNMLRDTSRRIFKSSNLQHSIDKRYHLQTAHMTAIRFKEPFKNAEQFINKTIELRNKKFGSCTVDHVELVGNNWYQQKEKVELIATFPLSKQPKS